MVGRPMAPVFPGAEWEWAKPDEVGLDPGRLEATRRWHADRAGEQPYRVVVVRAGRLAAEWEQGMATDEQRGMASATKSLFSSVLGIAIAEGNIGSADDRLREYFPEFMAVPEGRGPKTGRFAKPEDADITFRQLISNTSGYMKPGERPGQQFHYQTFGMNVLCHGIEQAYGLYDSSDPDGLPGIGQLIEEKLRDPIGGTWSYSYVDFEHPPGALVNIFGHSPRCHATARDMARLGLLWRERCRWGARQVVPEEWIQEAVTTAPDLRANCPREEWRYGHGFWTNDHGKLCPPLPRDSFAAQGAGRNQIWVCPSLDLVVAQSPGVYEHDWDDTNTSLILALAEACAQGPKGASG